MTRNGEKTAGIWKGKGEKTAKKMAKKNGGKMART